MPSKSTVAWFVCAALALGCAVAALLVVFLWKRPASQVKVSPEVLGTADVQAALTRLAQTASAENSGLLLPAEKALIGATQAVNGGTTVYAASNFACASIYAGNVSSGSGFIVAVNGNGSGTLVTGAHVVLQGGGAAAGAPVLSPLYAYTPQGLFELSLVGLDRAADVAVCSITANPRLTAAPLTFATASSPTGDDVWVMGDPLGIDVGSIAGGTVRDGKYVPGEFAGSVEAVYTSAPILPGNSGGPFLNRAGQVIGLANWVVSLSGATKPAFSGGVNSYMASRIVPRLIAGTHDRSYLGVERYDLLAGGQAVRLAQAYASTFDIGITAGVVLLQLDPSGPLATQAGLQVDDIIVEVAGVTVGAYADQYAPTRATWFHASGTPISLSYMRPSSALQIAIPINVTTAAYPSAKDVPNSTAF